MAVNYNATVQQARLDAVLAAIDAHASPAYIEIGTAAMAATLVTITLADPSFVRSGTTPGVDIKLTILGVPKSGVAGASGTAAAARIRTGGAVDVVTGLTVGTSATDIILNSTSITNGQTVTLTAGTINHPL